MIERTFGAAFFNRICNMPGVREYLAGEGELDVTAVVENPMNFALRASHGGFIVLNHGRCCYSVHSQFAPEGRSETVPAMRAGFDYMFTRTDCMKIFSHIPDNNKPAQGLARAAGFRSWFRRADIGGLGPGEMVSLDIDTWIAGNKALEEDGQRFHAVMDAALAGLDKPMPDHPPDPVHDRYVGATTRMCRRGQAAKGVALYNIWCAAAGYTPVTLLSETPPVVDCSEPGLVNMVLGLDTAGELAVLKCQSV